jgi:hypothetical protein
VERLILIGWAVIIAKCFVVAAIGYAIPVTGW